MIDKTKVVLVICICSFAVASCLVRSKSYWDSEGKKVEQCRSKWIYQDLQKEQQITVLLFSAKFSACLSSFPNFLIGITANNDTMAFVDKDFEGKIEIGKQVKLLPIQWNETEKLLIHPVFTVRKKSRENELYCKVQTVYYGKLE